MIRLASIFLGFFPLLFITTIKSEDVKITQQSKSKIAQGEEFVVEVKVEKGDIEGFAKYQLDIPKGLIAEQIEVLGATFTFDEGTIKIIWLALPSKNEFTFTYKIKVPEDFSNQIFKLKGRFSYLEENNRMIAEANKVQVQIGETEEEILAAIPPEPASAQAIRDVVSVDENTFEVEVTIAKSNIDGFSKIEDTYPEKFDISVIDDGGGVFSYVKNKAKFVWMNTPAADSYTIKYQIKTEGKSVDFNAVVGEYSYLDNNETKKVSIEVGALPSISTPAVLAENTSPTETENEVEVATEQEIAPQPKEEEITKTEEIANAKVKENKQVKEVEKKKTTDAKPKETVKKVEEVVEEIVEPVEASTKENITENIPSPQNGIIYRVQILAGKNLVNGAYFKANHNYEENFVTENHKGLVKYTTGSYDVYKSARDKREDLSGKYTLPGPFVTAYNNEQRITVQEALMILNQKWYK